jgi:hypothetical protein
MVIPVETALTPYRGMDTVAQFRETLAETPRP